MGMSTNIVGFIPPDTEWRKMKDVWDSCVTAGVAPPEEVCKFFNGEDPDEAGVLVDIETTEWGNDYASGYEVDVGKLPEHVKIVRFYNSW